MLSTEGWVFLALLRVTNVRAAVHDLLQVVQANLGKYLGEAAASIFSPTQDTVPWGGSPFTGGPRLTVTKNRPHRRAQRQLRPVSAAPLSTC